MFSDRSIERLENAAGKSRSGKLSWAWANDEIIQKGLELVMRPTRRGFPLDGEPIIINSLAASAFLANGRPRSLGFTTRKDTNADTPVLIPLHCKLASHWSLLVLCGVGRRQGVHLDSNQHSSNWKIAQRMMILLKRHCRDLIWGPDPEPHPTLHSFYGIPQQYGAWECGYCVILLAKEIVDSIRRHRRITHVLPVEALVDIANTGQQMFKASRCRAVAQTLIAWHDARKRVKKYKESRLDYLFE